MSDTNEPTTQASRPWDGHNVIAVSFEDDRNAYKAMTALKQLDTQGQLGVREAVIAVRDQDGQLVAKERVESPVVAGTAGGGLIGLLLGVIGGPLGVLIGGTYGLLVGSLFDLEEMDETGSALSAISTSARLDHTALLAVVDEQSPEAIDIAMTDLGGTVTRRAVADVEAELAAAERAERKAKAEARKELVRGRREHDRAAAQAKVQELKRKLHHEQPAGAAS